MADVSGTWSGTYWQREQPTRFQATFVQGGQHLSGRILDDGSLGEAQISGDIHGRGLTFLKRYLLGRRTTVRYSGTLSEDGNYMAGRWSIVGFDEGDWEASRQDDALAKELQRLKNRGVPAVPSRSSLQR